jgi:hypothetical protein
VITRIVVASRAHGLPWKRAAKWTLLLAILPIGVLFADRESALFGYQTSIAWDTFRVRQITQFVTDAGLRIGLLFLALAGLEAALPYALNLGMREGRARFGRSAVVAALTAISILVVAYIANQHLSHAVRSSAEVSIDAPTEVTTAFPALVELTQAFLGAIIASAAIALFATAIRTRLALITIIGITFAMLDPSATLAQTPLMALRALATALILWVVAKYVLDANPLAWPLTFFLLIAITAANSLLHHHRPDLIANGIAVLVFAIAAVVWALATRPLGPQPSALGPVEERPDA